MNDDNATPDDDVRITQRIVKALDEDADALDDPLSARLATARRNALASADRRLLPTLPAWFSLPVALTGMAAVLTVSVVVSVLSLDQRASLEASADSPVPLGALPLLSASEDLEFIGSVDFLLWLDDQRA